MRKLPLIERPAIVELNPLQHKIRTTFRTVQEEDKKMEM